MQLDRDWIAAHLPHRGAMCLLDGVLDWDERGVRCRASSHRDIGNPLRVAQRLPAACGIEYGAQAMAVHGGVIARARGGRARPGLLVALRGVELHVARLDDLPGPIQCEAEVLVAGDDGWQYRFTVRHGGALLAEGRAAVVLQPPSTPDHATTESRT